MIAQVLPNINPLPTAFECELYSLFCLLVCSCVCVSTHPAGLPVCLFSHTHDSPFCPQLCLSARLSVCLFVCPDEDEDGDTITVCSDEELGALIGYVSRHTYTHLLSAQCGNSYRRLEITGTRVHELKLYVCCSNTTSMNTLHVGLTA